MKDAEEQGRMAVGGKKGNWKLRAAGKETVGPNSKLEDFMGLDGAKPTDDGIGAMIGEDGYDAFKSKPIADLFPGGSTALWRNCDSVLKSISPRLSFDFRRVTDATVLFGKQTCLCIMLSINAVAIVMYL